MTWMQAFCMIGQNLDHPTGANMAVAALSYEHAGRIEAQLKLEVVELMAKAEAADKADVPDGMSIPDKLARRDVQLGQLAEARAKIGARAKLRFELEKAEHERDVEPMSLSVCYYPEHWPEPVWVEDARRMRALGIEYVRIGEFAWSRLEPGRGDFIWGWLDRVFDTLGAAGLKIVLGTPTATPPLPWR